MEGSVVKLPDVVALKKKYKVSPAMLVLVVLGVGREGDETMSILASFSWAEKESLEARLPWIKKFLH